jgi:hypothetical protein
LFDNDTPPADAIDVRAARRLAKCDLACVWRWVQTGKLRHWRQLGRDLVSRAELLALIGADETPPVPKPVCLPCGCLRPR